MRYESGTNYIFLILQMLVKCCFFRGYHKVLRFGSRTTSYAELPVQQLTLSKLTLFLARAFTPFKQHRGIPLQVYCYQSI